MSDQPKVQDLLRRVFVPIEYRTSTGNFAFRTTDREAYWRDSAGVIRRIRKKTSKKERRKNAHS